MTGYKYGFQLWMKKLKKEHKLSFKINPQPQQVAKHRKPVKK